MTGASGFAPTIFHRGRMTDHRIGLTLYRLDAIMEGDIGEIFDSLRAYYEMEALKARVPRRPELAKGKKAKGLGVAFRPGPSPLAGSRMTIKQETWTVLKVLNWTKGYLAEKGAGKCPPGG